MSQKFQYTRLEYQAQAVQSIADVFADVHFEAALRGEINPTLDLAQAHHALKTNIEQVRETNQITIGPVDVPSSASAPSSEALNLDVLMETGTGKTFTFIETMFKLHQLYGIAKFVVLVPSNAIRQGTLKSLASTADFFAKEYNNEKISVFNYSNRAVQAFIHHANANISVLVATYQSFNKDKNTINKRGVEANLFSQAKSYMEALAAIRPVVIIDEPHRFVGNRTLKYLPKFNPLFTLRFGATFKGETDDLKFKNLIYTLDSLEAFRLRLVKSITVDTVSSASSHGHTLCCEEIMGKAGARRARLRLEQLNGKSKSIELTESDNLGERVDIHYLSSYVVEAISSKEIKFTNGFLLPLGESSSYGMLADEVQRSIITRAVERHFEREELLFVRGIKSLTLFFIDAVAKYLPEGTQPALLRQWFEAAYRTQLERTLAKPNLDKAYRAYLSRSAQRIEDVHKGYFARSHSEKGEEEAIKLILEEKEKLLSFDTDLRFIFSMWALQEGWDNPNVFTLCKLAPSHSKITKLQQIGRGLRLAVDQNLARVMSSDAAFEAINELTVVVPESEGDFVEAIQSEISAHSVRRVAKVFDDAVLKEYGIAPSTRMANLVLDELEEAGIIKLDGVMGIGTLCIDRSTYHAKRSNILERVQAIKGMEPAHAHKLQQYLDAYFDGYGRIKHKSKAAAPTLTVNPARYAKFKHLWENLNREAVLTYELDTPALIQSITQRIQAEFDVQPLALSVTTHKRVEFVHQVQSTRATYQIKPHTVYTLGEFVRALANATHLSYATIASVLKAMPAEKFAQIAHNENRALATLKNICTYCIYELIINRVSYQFREIKMTTALTDKTGALLAHLPASACGKELYEMTNFELCQRSLYEETWMPVDSDAERRTIDESNEAVITVFAKLPRINIPTPVGDYNPDFGYAIARGEQQDLYLIVETKGYDAASELGRKEGYKIASAKRFFEALKARGLNVTYKTKLNGEPLAALIASIDATTGASL